MLIVNRSLRINRNEFKDHRQRFVFLDDTADELAIALKRIIEIGHVLTRFIKLGRTGGRYAFAAGFGRNGKIEDDIRPIQRRIDVQQPIQCQTSRSVASQGSKQKTVGDNHLALNESGYDFGFEPVPEIGGMEKTE